MNTNSAELQRAHFDALRVGRVAEPVFRGYTGSLGVRLWDGTGGCAGLAYARICSFPRFRLVRH